jgi:hypothetical protein
VSSRANVAIDRARWRWVIQAGWQNEKASPTTVTLDLRPRRSRPAPIVPGEIGLNNGTMLPENAAALVGAGVLSVAAYPLVALQIRKRAKAPVPAPGSSDVVH